MNTYEIELEGNVLKVGFGQAAQNDRIVQDVALRLDEMIQDRTLAGGPLLRVNGPASMPVAFVLAHRLVHLYGAIAVFDPKLAEPCKYVVCITHNAMYKLGDLIE
jgi:CRISPR-associated protein Csx3